MLVAVLMVKNEAETIASTLMPLIEGQIKYFFILDTGSTDRTVSIADQLLKNAGVIYEISQETFIDFSTSRNRALILAETFFPQIPFMLMLDAEWHLYGIEDLLCFCQQEVKTVTPLFLIKLLMNNKTLDLYTPRLFRTSAKIRFSGVVHEVPFVVAESKVPSTAFIEFNPSHQGVQKSQNRWNQDLDLLLKDYQSTINQNGELNPRSIFYLAQTYECLGRFNEAYEYYQLRSRMNGFDEETFVATFRLGRIAVELDEKDERFSWRMAEEHFHHAFALRPHRIEPLVYIANHYWSCNIPLCYLYARYACDAPYPQDDVLFVKKSIYDYTRFEILSRSAFYLGEYQVGLNATQKALLVHPNTPHLLSNLKIYEAKLFDIKNSYIKI